MPMSGNTFYIVVIRKQNDHLDVLVPPKFRHLPTFSLSLQGQLDRRAIKWLESTFFVTPEQAVIMRERQHAYVLCVIKPDECTQAEKHGTWTNLTQTTFTDRQKAIIKRQICG